MTIFGEWIVEAAKVANRNAVEHGFWDDPKDFGTTIALFHSEVSEAFDEYRDGRGMHETYFKCPEHGNLEPGKVSERRDDGTFRCRMCWEVAKPEGIPTELADILIRVLDYVGQHKIDIVTAGNDKHAYNVTRPHKHGRVV